MLPLSHVFRWQFFCELSGYNTKKELSQIFLAAILHEIDETRHESLQTLSVCANN